MTYKFSESIDNKTIRKILNPSLVDNIARFLKYFVIIFTITVIAYSLFKWGIVEKVRVEGNSMLPNLVDQQDINIEKFVAKLGGFKRGQIIVINDKGKLLIKRIVGLSGETIELKNKSIFIFNNQYQDGIKLIENYIGKDANQNIYPTCKIPDCSQEYEKVIIGKQELYLLGDNRIDSKDSRYYGPIDKKIIHGILTETDVVKHTKFELPAYNLINT